MTLPTFPRSEVERVAAIIADILRNKIKGGHFTDPEDPHTWMDAGRGWCGMLTFFEWPHGMDHGEYGECRHSVETDDTPASTLRIMTVGDRKRPAYHARCLIHELAHAVLVQYTPDVFTETPWLRFSNCFQANENICRCVERMLLGDLGRGWLPEHGFYWD